MFLPVVCEGLVEVNVFLLGDIFRLSHPEWLGLVLHFELCVDFFDLLFLLVLLVVVFLFLDFDVVLLLLLFSLLLIVLLIGDFLLLSLLDLELNWERNELRVFLDQFLDALLLQELQVIVLDVKNNLSSSG